MLLDCRSINDNNFQKKVLQIMGLGYLGTFPETGVQKISGMGKGEEAACRMRYNLTKAEHKGTLGQRPLKTGDGSKGVSQLVCQ